MTGKTISHFKVLQKIGGGGMGVVYLAEDLNLKRQVALKFLPPHLSTDPEVKKRFMHEAEAASALNHPNICTIHEIGETDDNQLFIAMALYEGETLKERLEAGPLPTEEAVDVARQLADGLAAAHEQGITHRDIKPANIIVTIDGRVVVLDFGLAKLSGASVLTKSGSTLGTVYYMSPEQARGEPTGPEADIWALGVVMYEMVTGQRPFVGDYDQAVVYAILNQEPESVESLRSDVTPVVARVITEAMAKDPGSRPASMKIVGDDLRMLGGHTIVEKRSAIATLRSPWVLAAILTVLVAGTFLLLRWNERRSQIEWARQEALPAVVQLVGSREWSKAFAIAEQAETVIADDSMLVRLWPQMSRIVSFRSEPAGARVLRQEYTDEDSAWVELGSTPIDSIRHPWGWWKFRVEKDGYVASLRVLGSSQISGTTFSLDPTGVAPDRMVRVDGGEANLQLPGLDHLEPVDIGDYWLGKYEVTNREYKTFVDSGGYQNPAYWKHPFLKDGREISQSEAFELFIDRSGRPGPSTWSVGDYPDGQDEYPVSGLSWHEAAAFAEYSEMRLPTIFHWGRAAGTQRSHLIIPRSNFGKSGAVAVGSRDGIGPYGTLDMAGNVREWCLNETDSGERFILGGGWNDETYSFNDAYAQDPFDRSTTNGVRLLRVTEDSGSDATTSRSIRMPFRDFWTERPVSDEVFAVYLNMFKYDKTELEARIEDTAVSSPDWTRQRVTFNAAYGSERMTAYIYLPKHSEPPYQVVAYFPGSNAIHDRSAEHAGLQLGAYDFIVKGGRAVIFPVYKGIYERGLGLESSVPNESVAQREHVVACAKDLRRSLDYLETRPEFDSNAIGYFGLSWGGRIAPVMLATEDRIKAAVLHVGGLRFQRSLPQIEPLNYLPRVRIPVLMLNGKYDHFFPVETSQRPMFEFLGTRSDEKRQVIYESGHFVPRDQLVRETLAWLDKYLGPVE